MSQGFFLKRLRENPDTINAGNIWNLEEDKKLINEIQNNLSIEEISLLHKRTNKGIICRIFDLAIKEFNEGINIDDICLKYKIKKNELENEIQQKNNKKNNKNNIKDNNEKLLEEINKKLDIKIQLDEVNKKLDFILNILQQK